MRKKISLGMASSGRFGDRESGGGKDGKSTRHERRDEASWKRKGRRRISGCNGMRGGGKGLHPFPGLQLMQLFM